MAGGRGYPAVWRWHFYAGLFTAPFLLILAVTGAIYLFNDELNDWIYPQLMFAPSGDHIRPAGDLVAAARQAYPGGTVTRIDMPVSPGRSAMVFLTPARGEPLRVFVDPGNARVLGDFVYTHTLVGFADVTHGSLLLGDAGDALVELAASWALILVVTGLYLWFGGRQRARRVTRARPWRRIHRTVGIGAALMILFLLVTGLPWTGLWGGKLFTPAFNALGLGYPAVLRHHQSPPAATHLGDNLKDIPWTLQQAPLPRAHRHGQGDIGVNAVHRILAARGLHYGYRLSLPRHPGDPYSAYTYPARPEGQRTVQIDAASGAVLADTGFTDYGPAAKLIEWGVAIHMGNYFGRLNQALMLATCLAVIALVLSGVAMWWKRRPPGGFGAPGGAQPLPRPLLALILVLLVVLPLAGLSALLVMGVDRIIRRVRG